MKLVQVAEQNKKYYTKEFIHGFNTGAKTQYEADSKERTGRWKPFDLTWGRSIYACTACGDAFELPTECGKPMYKFCPYCGAKMDEVEE